MPRLAFAQSVWDGYDTLEKPIRAGVRKAMAKFQAMSVAELNADKGLHLESVENARDSRMRTIRITDFWRGVGLAPDDGSELFLRGLVAAVDGTDVVRLSATGPTSDAKGVGTRLAAELLDLGAADLMGVTR